MVEIHKSERSVGDTLGEWITIQSDVIVILRGELRELKAAYADALDVLVAWLGACPETCGQTDEIRERAVALVEERET